MKEKNEIQDTIENLDRIHVVMFFVSIVVLVLSALILARIVHIQTSYTVDAKVINLFRPVSQRHTEAPVRGRILSTDGRPFAISAPLYDIYMDCTIRKREFEEKNDADAEMAWREKARQLCVALSNEFHDKSADQYYNTIIQGREKGSKYLSIKKNVDLNTLRRVQTFPLFQEGGYRGGIIVESHEERIYPYDSLARRVIGYVKDTLRKGLEANFDYELHGKAGYEWRRVTDDNSWIRDLDSNVVRAQDGNDIRTTLNVDFQDIADRALRKQINENDDIRAGIVIIMEAQTGAIRAMVNLSRGATPQTTLWERENLCLTEVGEQGSVMKTVTLLSVVEDGHVKSLEQTLPTNNGFVPGGYKQDVHILDYQRETGRRDITVMHGFEISSNYVFTWLAENYYGNRPQELFDHIYSYRLGEAFDFDISGLGTPVVNRPGTAGWSKTTLGTTAYGYGISVTPLHVATFYNGIANKGRMMKPYLVESVEKNGRVIKRYDPSVLNNICSRNTADTVTRALRAVVERGTATRLKQAKLSVAGKTGTAQVVLTPQERAGSTDPYHDPWGRKKNQGTFVGFFPAENPKYTILVTVYSYLSGLSFYGGTLPALAVREIVDKIYALDPEWEQELHRAGSVPVMKKGENEQ